MSEANELGDAWESFESTLGVCRKLSMFIADPSRFTLEERSIVYEALLIRVFRSWENLLEKAFLAYLTGEKDMQGRIVSGYLEPRDMEHAREFLKREGNRFSEWADPTTVIVRCKLFFDDDPIRQALVSETNKIHWMRKIRNHVAHNSVESTAQYETVVFDVCGITSRPCPSPGELLGSIQMQGPSRKRVLFNFLVDHIESAGRFLVGIQ